MIEQYYRDNYKRKVKIVSFILRGDSHTAEDVVQEAFSKALQYSSSYDVNRGTVDKWFNSIMFNTLHRLQRDNKGVTVPVTDALSLEDIFSEKLLSESPDLRQYIESCIKKVENEKHRRILELFFVKGYTSLEIAQIEQRVTQTNVTTVVMRFRDSFK